MITCKYFSLPNLIAGRHVMPEFAPVDHPHAAVATMTEILHRWLTDEEEYSRQQSALARLRDEVATPGATENAASAILARLPGVDSAALRAA
jgi:lipid-A-disaccharide synthase